MSTGVSCTVLIDGERAADGSPGDDLSGPVILDDLAIAWGRSDTMSQPEADTCSFAVMDQLGGETFLDRYTTGRRVDVIARGLTNPAPGDATFVNPGFESTLVTWQATNGTAARSSARVHGGASSLRLTPTVAGQAATLLLAPGELQPAGTNPDAWDEIPTTTTPGELWRVTLSVWLPASSAVAVRPALFSGPYASAGVPTGDAWHSYGGVGGWTTIDVEIAVGIADRWVGLQLVFDPTGPSWAEVPPLLTWDTVDPTFAWDEYGVAYVDDAQVLSPDTGSSRGVLVFSGRITDTSASWDDSTSSPVAKVTAVGFTADLQNRLVGDEPWPVEDVELRAHRILDLAGLPISIDIDPALDDTLLSYRDVDRQGATGLLQQVATSVDGVLWHAVHQSIGAYLRLEDPASRAALLQLALDGGLIVIVQGGDPADSIDLSACLVLRDPVTWVRDVSDVVTRVSVSWLVQGVDDGGLPTTSEASELVVDAELEARYGTRNASISTQLQAAADAQAVAQRVMARSAPESWRASGLTIDDDDVDPTLDGIELLLLLLDGTSRIGAAIVLGELPSWTPAGASVGVYLEGGSYRFVGGRWVLDLTVSASTGLGESAAWDELDPAWTWDQWSPEITWDDLRGVAAD